MQEFKNSESNHLGIPLPKGRLRFYRHKIRRTVRVHQRKCHRRYAQRRNSYQSTGNAFENTANATRPSFLTSNPASLCEVQR